jgi:hypothetical protein
VVKKNDDKESVAVVELLLRNAIEQEALFNILLRKCLITKKEIVDEIKKLRKK